MTFPEMIYKLALFFYSNLWTYLGTIIIILTIRGDITKALKSVGGFFSRVKVKYKELSKPITLDKAAKK